MLGAARPLCDLGIGNAVVQRADLSGTAHPGGVHGLHLAGRPIAAAIALVAPLAAALLRHPEVTVVLRVLAVEFAIGGTTVVAGALLRRRLDFRRHVSIETASTVIGYGAVSVTLALLGFGVWSLVWGALMHSAIATLLFFAVSQHATCPCWRGRNSAICCGSVWVHR